MENITGSMATSVIIAHSSLLIILTIVIVFVYLYLNFETNRDGKQCKCGKASVIGAQGQQLSVLPPVPGQPSPSPVKFVQLCTLSVFVFEDKSISDSLHFVFHWSLVCIPPSSVKCEQALFLYFHRLPWSSCINISDSLQEKWPSKGRRVFCTE